MHKTRAEEKEENQPEQVIRGSEWGKGYMICGRFAEKNLQEKPF